MTMPPDLLPWALAGLMALIVLLAEWLRRRFRMPVKKTRLQHIAPELRYRLNSASKTQLRRIAAAVSRTIVERLAISHPIITQALEQLDTFGSRADGLQAKVQAYADEVDNGYFDLAEECEAGRASQEEVSIAFSKARAISAVAFALDRSALIAASEATYEVASAIDDDSVIISLAEKIVEQRS